MGTHYAASTLSSIQEEKRMRCLVSILSNHLGKRGKLSFEGSEIDVCFFFFFLLDKAMAYLQCTLSIYTVEGDSVGREFPPIRMHATHAIGLFSPSSRLSIVCILTYTRHQICNWKTLTATRKQLFFFPSTLFYFIQSA